MKITMQYLVASLALLTTGHALTCEVSAGMKWGPDCTAANTTSEPLAQICYVTATWAGCLPLQYASSFPATAGCSADRCWCFTDNCNNASLLASTQKCWSGIAGSNEGPSCEESALHKSSEYKKAPCTSRVMPAQCVENNKHIGMGDGCGGHPQKDEVACNGTSGEKRNVDESYDGTERHCRWVKATLQSEKQGKCQVDDKCTFHADRSAWNDGGVCSGTATSGDPCNSSSRQTDDSGDDCTSNPGAVPRVSSSCTWTPKGTCEESDNATAAYAAWRLKEGTKGCGDRMKFGCYEYHGGEDEKCTSQKNQSFCLAVNQSCDTGYCYGPAVSNGKNCSDRANWECEQMSEAPNPCKWKTQCCQWLPFPADERDTCLNLGKGTLDGLCRYSDGVGPPSAEVVKLGFDYTLFNKDMQADVFTGKCAIIASFVNGSGAATAIGSNKADLLGSRCKKIDLWKVLGEHIGHTNASIDAYCMNFIPDSSVMEALKNHTPSYVIEKVEQGQFEAVFPGLVGLKYIVTAKPAFGKCLFFASGGKWGTAVCTCDTIECNGFAALELIVDPNTGPMRLLQFIDGSLLGMRDAINNKVAMLITPEGEINPGVVDTVTEVLVDEIMGLAGMSDKTNREELWNVTQDYQMLMQAQAAYKTSLLAYPVFNALKIDASKVIAANNAAGALLYFADGVPLTFTLQGLSDASVTAVANATKSGLTGPSEQHLKLGRTWAQNAERFGVAALANMMSTTTTTVEQVATLVTSVGQVEVKMTKAHATLLTANISQAKAAFASAIAKTINLPASDIEIMGIYIDGVRVDVRRLSTESSVRVDWKTLQAVAIQPAAINATVLKTNIQVEAKAIANVTVVITALPTSTVIVQTPPPASTTPASGSASGQEAANSVSCWCLASSVLMCMLLMLLP